MTQTQEVHQQPAHRLVTDCSCQMQQLQFLLLALGLIICEIRKLELRTTCNITSEFVKKKMKIPKLCGISKERDSLQHSSPESEYLISTCDDSKRTHWNQKIEELSGYWIFSSSIIMHIGDDFGKDISLTAMGAFLFMPRTSQPQSTHFHHRVYNMRDTLSGHGFTILVSWPVCLKVLC